MLDDVIGQGAGVADGTGEHGGLCILAWADDACNFQRDRIVIEVLDAGVGVPQVGVQSGIFVVVVAVGVEDDTEFHVAEFVISPLAGGSVLQLGAVCGGADYLAHLGFRLQSQCVQRGVIQFVVFIHHQNDLVVVLRPFAVYHVVLLFQQAVDGLSVIAGEHLLPNLTGHSAHGGHEGTAHQAGVLGHLHHRGNVHVHIF